MIEPTGAEPALVVHRVLPAPPEDVFAAWTNPDSLARWMSPFSQAEASLDLRVGGAFRIVMKGLGQEIEHVGEYREIDPPRRLVFTWRSAYTGATPSVVTVDLRPNGDRTEMTLTHAQLPPDQIEPHRGGWGSILDHLDRYLRGSTTPA